MKKKNGFVMIETIIVISVLSVGLISMYASYALILNKTNTISNYDMPSDVYRSYSISKYLFDLSNGFTSFPIVNNNGYVIINVDDSSIKNTTLTNLDYDVLKDLNVEKVYIFKDTRIDDNIISNITSNTLINYFDGSTIEYLFNLDDFDSWTYLGTSSSKYQIVVVVKFKNNNLTSNKSFAYIKAKTYQKGKK